MAIGIVFIDIWAGFIKGRAHFNSDTQQRIASGAVLTGIYF
jgi:hypothetical protein